MGVRGQVNVRIKKLFVLSKLFSSYYVRLLLFYHTTSQPKTIAYRAGYSNANTSSNYEISNSGRFKSLIPSVLSSVQRI